MKAIFTKYHGPTNCKGERISASDQDGNKVFIPYPNQFCGEAAYAEAAKALCAKMGWSGSMAAGGLKDGYVFVWTEPVSPRGEYIMDGKKAS
jgi:hypothetical protein